MSVAEALAELQAILGKGLYPAAIPKIREVLVRLEEGNVADSQMSDSSKHELRGSYLST
jgi:hypothetical protein